MKVLFIGNSFTARNDLPGMVAHLAESAGEHFEHQLISVGGASLRTHWNKGVASRAIEADGYDRVVLQEQSTLPIKNAARMLENVKLFAPVIRAAGAEPVLYLTWARRHTPEAQELITEAYLDAAREIRAAVIPAGVAWARVLEAADNASVLHDRDGSHPAIMGTFLAACCAFATLFRRSPVGLPGPQGVSASDAKWFERVAWQAMKAVKQATPRRQR